MSTSSSRMAALAAIALCSFGVSCAILLQLVPQPRRETDYLVVGSVATMVALVVLFVAIVTGWCKTTDIFYRRRKNGGAQG